MSVTLDKTPRMLEIEAEHGGKDIADILRESYNRNESLVEAAKELGINHGTARRWAIEFGIPMRRIAYTSYIRDTSPDRDTRNALARLKKKQEQRQAKLLNIKKEGVGIRLYPEQHEWLRRESKLISAELGIDYGMSDWIADRIEEHRKGQQ